MDDGGAEATESTTPTSSLTPGPKRRTFGAMHRSRPRTRSEVDLVVMGYSAPNASPTAKIRMTEFGILLSQFAMIDVSMTAVGSYERVAQLIHRGEIDLAWLSPIPFISLARQGSVSAIASPFRRGRTGFDGALIVPSSSRARTLSQLQGKRAAWVDRHSASGFVLPRVEFWEAGIDPRRAFSTETFYGSHEAVVRAVAKGAADFGATHVGSWTQGPYATRVRSLATFGEIPADVIAVRADLDPKAREIVTRAFLRLSSVPQGLTLVHDVFGADDFRKADVEAYERLRDIAAGANEDGILELGPGAGRPEEEESPDATIRTRAQPRPRADSTMEIDLVEDVTPPPPRARMPSRPTYAKPAAKSTAAARPTKTASKPASPPRPAIAPRPASPRPGARPLPPRKT